MARSTLSTRAVYAYTWRRHRISETLATVRSPLDTLPVLASLFEGRETEALAVLLLDTKGHVIGAETVYTGNVSASLVRVGELFRSAVRLNASSVIIAHNHPSGDPTPSPDDLHLTAEVLAAGRLLDIDVLDHVIIADDGRYASLRERGVAFDRRPAVAV
jgi:DNA repair protein RadC